MVPKLLARLLVILIVGTIALLGAGTVSAQSDPEPVTCPECCATDGTSGSGAWVPGRLGPGRLVGPGGTVGVGPGATWAVPPKKTSSPDAAAAKGQAYRAWFGKGRLILPVLPQPRVR